MRHIETRVSIMQHIETCNPACTDFGTNSDSDHEPTPRPVWPSLPGHVLPCRPSVFLSGLIRVSLRSVELDYLLPDTNSLFS